MHDDLLKQSMYPVEQDMATPGSSEMIDVVSHQYIQI